jgi:hypothetical protein
MHQVFGYNDSWGWGKRIVAAAEKRNWQAALFSSADKLRAPALAFMHPTHLPAGDRLRDKKVAEVVAIKSGMTLTPTLSEIRLYDDKLAQARVLADYTPPTQILENVDEAEAIVKSVVLPFISKSAEGAGGSNVRLITSIAQAKQEIELAFRGPGIRKYDGLMQQGYLLWQDFVVGGLIDWRVVLVAQRFALMTCRRNKFQVLPDGFPGAYVSAVSRRREICICPELTDETLSVLNFSRNVCERFGFQFFAGDLIRDYDGAVRLLETSTGFVFEDKRLDDFVFLEYSGDSWQPSKYRWPELFDLTLDCYEAGLLNGARSLAGK